MSAQKLAATPLLAPPRFLKGADGTALLELRVSIDGQPQSVLLSLDEPLKTALSDQGAVDELRLIRKALEDIRKDTCQLAHRPHGPGIQTG